MKRSIGLGDDGRYEPLALALLRVYAGGVILLAHGLPKLRELLAGGGHFFELVEGMGVLEVGLVYMVILTVIMIGGPGAFAVDRFLFRRPAPQHVTKP